MTYYDIRLNNYAPVYAPECLPIEPMRIITLFMHSPVEHKRLVVKVARIVPVAKAERVCRSMQRLARRIMERYLRRNNGVYYKSIDERLADCRCDLFPATPYFDTVGRGKTYWRGGHEWTKYTLK